MFWFLSAQIHALRTPSCGSACCGINGLTIGEIYRFAESIHNGKAVSFWWTMGVNQSHEAAQYAAQPGVAVLLEMAKPPTFGCLGPKADGFVLGCRKHLPNFEQAWCKLRS